MYFLQLSFIPEEDPTLLYFDFILVKRISYQSDKFCFPIFIYSCKLELVLCVSKHSYAMTIFLPTYRLYKCAE